MIRIRLASVMVRPAKARDFYTGKLGFRPQHDIPMGGASWLTVIAADDPTAPSAARAGQRPARAPIFQRRVRRGIPATAFGVDDIQAEFERLKAAGVTLRGAPTPDGPGPSTLLIEDGCGNLLQLYQIRPEDKVAQRGDEAERSPS